MKTAAQAAALLVCGTLSRSEWPELADEDFAADVRGRLTQVGLDLAAANGRWLARPRQTYEADGFEPTFELHAVELAMVAALYLHLRFLPRQTENPLDSSEEPSVDVDDVVAAFPGYQRRYIEQMVLGRLRNAGFVRREDRRLYAGPYLAAVDEVAADERCKEALRTFLVRRYLKRKADELDGGTASSPQSD